MRAHYRNDIAGTNVGGVLMVPVVGASVSLYEEGTTTPIAETIYAAATGGTTLSNPLTTGAAGALEFWLEAPKRLDLYVVRSGFADQRITVDVHNIMPNRIEWGTGAPTVGDWKIGDVVWNIATTTGNPFFWQCSVSGTPGTWKAGPNAP
jgi:hypothetical protein